MSRLKNPTVKSLSLPLLNYPAVVLSYKSPSRLIPAPDVATEQDAGHHTTNTRVINYHSDIFENGEQSTEQHFTVSLCSVSSLSIQFNIFLRILHLPECSPTFHLPR